jgi:hypothetical protein
MSGNWGERGSGIRAVLFDVGFGVGGPFFIDIDDDGADEAFE